MEKKAKIRGCYFIIITASVLIIERFFI
jgi:hypothetical protein